MSDAELEMENTNEGLADAMAKVLNKQAPKDKSSAILGKSNTIEENDEEEIQEKKDRRKRVTKKRKWEKLNYVKPSVQDPELEKSLQKIATRGVIQLFNAVKKHQKELDDKLQSAKTETKKDKVLQQVDKGKFLDMLKDGPKTKKNKTSTEAKSDDAPAPAWSVLREDFMLGNNMKDWDKQTEDDAKTRT